MISTLVGLYSRGQAHPIKEGDLTKELKFRKLAVFLSITFGYGFYYVCRLSFSVAKKPMLEAGIFNAAEMGIIGSALFFAYAFGKFFNGFISDRVNIRKFMFTGLLVSAIINFLLGFTTYFWFFVILWTLNGWFQSFGAPSSVVALSHWYDNKERGRYYGMWATSHNIGEAITFILTAVVISSFGWMWGFRIAGISCFLVAFVILKFLYEKPENFGLPSPVHRKDDAQNKNINKLQLAVLKNPAVWILALASAFMYVTRYSIYSWGIFFLEAQKGYSTIEASSIIATSSVAGIFGTFFSGILSDKLFNGKRNLPALIFGIIYTLAVALFLLGPQSLLIDSLSMILFGVSLGVLLVYLGGLMAIDICSRESAGAVMGLVGIFSYIGAAIQDITSGYLIETNKVIVSGITVYNFDSVSFIWIGSAVISLVLATLVWNVKVQD